LVILFIYLFISEKKKKKKKKTCSGRFNYELKQTLKQITILGVPNSPTSVQLNGANVSFEYDSSIQELVVSVTASMVSAFTLTWN